ncbi:hypothetical protein [Parasphingorhabdus sp.]|uniref:hypothetical protein n=1 Tax=Parasphingorhabdus sp. TaxID=2709688 RepID=UPI003A95B259
MAPRKRNNNNRDLPPYLYFESGKGYRLTLTNGERKVISKNRTEAIIIATEYNRLKRASMLDVILSSDSKSSPLAEHCDAILERMITDKEPGKSLLSTWNNDMARVKGFFNMPGNQIDLGTVTDYMDEFHGKASNNVYNRKLGFLELVFDYAKDIGEMKENPAKLKIKRPKEAKKRKALDVKSFTLIREAAPLWLKTAMDLTLQTTHAVLEISRIEYKIKKAEQGRCGCIWYDEPTIVAGDVIYGEIAIHRQKTHKAEASHVVIPIGQTIKDIIDASRDNIASPYVVHKLPKSRSNPMSKEVKHITQIVSHNISREFSNVRDQLGLFSNLPKEERPTYHEIRGMAARLIEAQGISPQERMGHSDSKSTKIYTSFGKGIEWVQVPHIKVQI